MDPISPELVLVDPELGRLARAQLPDPASSNGRATPAQESVIARAVPRGPIVIAGAVPRAPIVAGGAVARSTPAMVRLPLVRLREAAVAELEAEPEPPRWPGRKLFLVAAGLCLFLLGVFIPPVVTGGDPAPSGQPRASEEERPAPAIPRPATSAGPARRSTPQPPETRVDVGEAARSPGPVSATREAKPPRTTAPTRRGAPSPIRREERARKSTSGRVPTHLFVWLPSREASYYNVRFFKGTQTVFEAWPTDARVTVPMRGTFRGRRFAFTSGRYRWEVRPAFGPRSSGRYGEPIVRSVWTLKR